MRQQSRSLVVLVAAAALLSTAAHAADPPIIVQWTPHEIRLAADQDHPWWSFPVKAELTHEQSGQRLVLEGYWDGGRDWIVRFAAPLAGRWKWQTVSADPGLHGKAGELEVRAPSAEETARSANSRGHLKISPDGRYFTYADGTPALVLADTLWSGNTARCGLGQNEDGPFFQYLADRQAKGFTAVLMKYLNGFDDHVDRPTGDRNEGGYAFVDADFTRLNAAYFQALDRRLAAIQQRGMIAALPAAWWGKTSRCAFDIEEATRLSAYCAVRYGAFNALWCLSGEYQYTFNDCSWTKEDLDGLGEAVQSHNPYRHPLSIHPSGRTNWPPPHNVQSSLPFHESKWLDHHWLQTGQSADRLHYIVSRAAENRNLKPARPVFCSESFYDRADNPDQVYHARWQALTAMLSGCAGYGYGAQGIWQFYEPAEPQGETGNKVNNFVPWQQALEFEGSRMIRPVRTLLESLEWWKLTPARAMVLVDAKANWMPTSSDLTPPTCAAIAGQMYVVYIPRGNAARKLKLVDLPSKQFKGRWFDPRAGTFSQVAGPAIENAEWTVAERPAPREEDWVVVLEVMR